MITLYETPGENISFGRGLAQRAHISDTSQRLPPLTIMDEDSAIMGMIRRLRHTANDVGVILLSEAPGENVSFGQGLAQRAFIS